MKHPLILMILDGFGINHSDYGNAIHAAKKPVITIKPCAAGRTTPFVGLNFSYNTIREQDMVCIGCFNEEEAAEDIEFARAAIERRLPRNEGRNSPLKTDVIKGAV